MAAGTITNEKKWSSGHGRNFHACTIEMNGTTAVTIPTHMNTVFQAIVSQNAAFTGHPYVYSMSGGTVSLKSDSASDTSLTVNVLSIGV